MVDVKAGDLPELVTEEHEHRVKELKDLKSKE